MLAAQQAVEVGADHAEMKLTSLQQNTFELRQFIDDVANWVKPHDRWDLMTPSDRLDLDALIARSTAEPCNPTWPHLFYPINILSKNITSIDQECDATFRTVARGPEHLFQKLP